MAYSPKEGNISATFGPYFYKTDYSPQETKRKNSLKPGFGLIANGDISDYGALEVAMIHMDKLFFIKQGDFLIAEQTQLIHVTMGYRYWFSKYFSSALGLYSSYALGEKTIVYNGFPSGEAPRTSANDITEYGLDMALTSELWTKKQTSVNFEARYSWSLTSKDYEKSDHYGFLLALRYLIQEKIIQTKP